MDFFLLTLTFFKNQFSFIYTMKVLYEKPNYLFFQYNYFKLHIRKLNFY